MQVDVIRAWKDPFYRSTLSAGELDRIPSHPSGLIDLEDDQLKSTPTGPFFITTAPTCTEYTLNNHRPCCPRW